MSTFRPVLLLLAAVLLAAAFAGCGGGAGDDKPATPTITDADLEAMVPTKADFGEEFAGFQESGAPDTNEARIQASDDPENEKQDQQTFGRITGYNRKLMATPATLQTGAPLLIQMGATLFGDGTGGANALGHEVQEIQARVGKTISGCYWSRWSRSPCPRSATNL